MCLETSHEQEGIFNVYRGISLLAEQAKVKKEHPRRISMEC